MKSLAAEMSLDDRKRDDARASVERALKVNPNSVDAHSIEAAIDFLGEPGPEDQRTGRQLPQRLRGYYREYTVPTPGASNRGSRRIVCGGIPAQQPEVCYYSDDHYASFRRIAQ